MKKILLISPSQLYAPNWGATHTIKLYLLSLYSFLKLENEVNILDLEIEIGRPKSEEEIKSFKEKTIKLISQYKFDIAAISCWTSLNYLSSVIVAEICKNINSSCIVVTGGYHASAVPGDFTYPKSPFDFVVVGEGEISLSKICKREGKRSKGTKVVNGIPLDLKQSFPLDWRGYKYANPAIRKAAIYLSRGCPYSCAFCMEAAKGYSGWRSYSIKKAFEELDRVIDVFNPRIISFLDPCFGFNKKWRRKFLNKLIKRKIKKIFWAETRIDLLEKEDIDLFSKLNFVVHFGAESFSGKMLSIMRKTNNPYDYLKRAREILNYANKRKVPNRLGLIFSHPGETLDTFRETIAFCRSLVEDKNETSTLIDAQDYALFPGSYVYFNLDHYIKEYGTTIKNREWWKQKGDHRYLSKCLMASKDLEEEVGLEQYWIKDICDLWKICTGKMSIETRLILDSFFCDYNKFYKEKLLPIKYV